MKTEIKKNKKKKLRFTWMTTINEVHLGKEKRTEDNERGKNISIFSKKLWNQKINKQIKGHKLKKNKKQKRKST